MAHIYLIIHIDLYKIYKEQEEDIKILPYYMKSKKYIKRKTKHSNKGKRTHINRKRSRKINKKYKGGAGAGALLSMAAKVGDVTSKAGVLTSKAGDMSNPLGMISAKAGDLKIPDAGKLGDIASSKDGAAASASGALTSLTDKASGELMSKGKALASKAATTAITGAATAAFGPLGGLVAKAGLNQAKNLKMPDIKNMKPPKVQIIPPSFFMTIINSMVGIGKAVLLMPTLALNQVVPPHLCKYYLKNDKLCSQTTLDYFIKGSRPDYLKREIENDKCIEFNPETNKYEQCKPTRFKDEPKLKGGSMKGASMRGGTKELILKCKGKINHGLHKHDKVIVFYPENVTGNQIVDNVYVGKIVSITGQKDEIIGIQIENGNEISVKYNEEDINVRLYSEIFETFIHEYKKYYIESGLDAASKRIEWGVVMSFYLLFKGIGNATILAVFVAIGVPTIATVGVVTVSSIPLALIVGICWICEKISTNKSLKKIYLAKIKKLIENDSVRTEKRNTYILEQLVKINHQLKMYQCPRDKLESIFENINDIKLLEKIYKLIDKLIEDKNYYDQKTCDIEYEKLRKAPPTKDVPGEVPYFDAKTAKLLTKFKLNPDIEHVDAKNYIKQFVSYPNDTFHKSPHESCEDINRFDPLKILDSFDKTIRGNKDNITYIVIHIFKDIFEGKSENESHIQKYTRLILQNIQCRSDILGVIAERIVKLDI